MRLDDADVPKEPNLAKDSVLGGGVKTISFLRQHPAAHTDK